MRQTDIILNQSSACWKLLVEDYADVINVAVNQIVNVFGDWIILIWKMHIRKVAVALHDKTLF